MLLIKYWRYALLVAVWLIVAFAAAIVLAAIGARLPAGAQGLVGLVTLVVLFGVLIAGPLWSIRRFGDRIRGRRRPAPDEPAR